MDSNNSHPAHNNVAPPTSDAPDWRTQLLPDARDRIITKIVETVQRHLPWDGEEGMKEIRGIAIRFEDKIYTVATSLHDYLRKISLKMLVMEAKYRSSLPNALPSNSSGMSNNLQDSDSVPDVNSPSLDS